MPQDLTLPQRTLVALLVLPILAALAVLAATPSHAQEAPTVSITQFPGAAVDYLRSSGETHTMVTYCPPGQFAISGGWGIYSGPSRRPLAAAEVIESYASQLPGGGLPGAWTLTVRKTSPGPALVVPSVTCLAGAGQQNE